MSTDPWHNLLSLCEFPDARLVAEQAREWPAGALAEFLRLGLIRETAPQSTTWCESCDDAPVHDIYWERSDLALLLCPQYGPQPIDVESLRCWDVETSALLQFLVEQLQARGPISSVVPERLWQLGKVYWKGRPTTLFFGRDLFRRDAREALRLVDRFQSALVLVPRRLPLKRLRNPVAALADIAGWNGTTVDIDLEFADAQIAAPQSRARKVSKRDTNRILVRQRLKRELELHVQSACDQIRSQIAMGREPTLLPCPTRAELAQRCETSPPTVTRCFQDDEELERLWRQAHDLLDIVAAHQA